MNPIFPFVAVALVLAQIAVPRRFAFLPLLIAACHVSTAQILPSLTVVRLLVLVGMLRAFSGGQLVGAFRHPLDKLMLAWAGWAVLSAFGHEKKEGYNPLTVHTALAFDYVCTYFYTRAFLRDKADFIRFSKSLVFVLIPFALLLLVEKLTGRNVYAAVGAIIEQAWVRDGKIRAAGPFGNAILAGTVGGVFVPLMVYLHGQDQYRRLAQIGGAACLVIIYCSASSGPVMSLVAAVAGLALWRWRQYLQQIKNGVFATIIALAIVMEAPIWYLIARVDLAGGSTSWHRAELIDQAVRHFGEWWLVGSDYTRHWMPYGIQWSEDHVDITNQYVNMGVRGGVLLMGLFIAILVKAFRLLGRKMQALRKPGDPAEFMLWCIGATLFAHAFTFMAVSYFDQSYVFFCLMIGVVPALCATDKRLEGVRTAATDKDEPFVPQNGKGSREVPQKDQSPV